MERRSFFITFVQGTRPGRPFGILRRGCALPVRRVRKGCEEEAEAARGEEEDEERGAEDERGVQRPPGGPLEVVEPVEEVDPAVRALRSGLTSPVTRSTRTRFPPEVWKRNAGPSRSGEGRTVHRGLGGEDRPVARGVTRRGDRRQGEGARDTFARGRDRVAARPVDRRRLARPCSRNRRRGPTGAPRGRRVPRRGDRAPSPRQARRRPAPTAVARAAAPRAARRPRPTRASRERGGPCRSRGREGGRGRRRRFCGSCERKSRPSCC